MSLGEIREITGYLVAWAAGSCALALGVAWLLWGRHR